MIWFFLLAVFAIIGLAYYALHRDSKGDSDVTIPFFGGFTIKSGVPAVVLCVLAVVSLFFAYKLKSAEDQATAPAKTVMFRGQVDIDPGSVADISSIEVGVTSAPWIVTQTPDATSPTIMVTIPVPDS